MLIAVTGASGDVGSEVVKVVLASGHAVRAIDVSENMQLEGSTDKVEFVRADLCSYEKVLEVLKGCDAVSNVVLVVTSGHCSGLLVRAAGTSTHCLSLLTLPLEQVISSAGIPNCINHPEHIVHNM